MKRVMPTIFVVLGLIWVVDCEATTSEKIHDTPHLSGRSSNKKTQNTCDQRQESKNVAITPTVAREHVQDAEGDSLPPGAIMRFGTTRFRTYYGVTSLAYSPDGKLIATGGGGEIIVWNPINGKRQYSIRSLSTVSALAFSPNSKLLASGCSTSPQVFLWEAATGKKVAELKTQWFDVYSIAFSPDGRLVAFTKYDAVSLWEVNTGTLVKDLDHEDIESEIRAIAFSPDGKLLAMGFNREIWLWRIKDWQVYAKFQLDRHTTSQIAFGPQGKILGVLGTNIILEQSLLSFWNIGNGDLIEKIEYKNKTMKSFSFHPDRNKVAIAGDGTGIWLLPFPSEKKRPKKKVLKTLEGHIEDTHALAFSPDGRWLVSGGDEGAVAVWDLKTGNRRIKPDVHTEAVLGVDFSPDGKILATGSADKTVRFWDIKTGKSVRKLEGHTTPVQKLGYSPDGSLLFSQSKQGVILWDMKKYQQFCTIGYANIDDFDPTSKKIISSSSSSISIWESKTCNRKNKVVYDKGFLFCVGSIGSGEKLMALSTNRSILVDTSTGQIQPHMNWDRTMCSAPLEISSDGTRFAGELLQERRTLVVRRSDTGKIEREIKSKTSSTKVIRFSKDGRYLAATNRRSIQVWDLTDGKLICDLTGHIGGIWNIAFSPDACLLASASLDSTVLIWETGALGCKAGKYQNRSKNR